MASSTPSSCAIGATTSSGEADTMNTLWPQLWCWRIRCSASSKTIGSIVSARESRTMPEISTWSQPLVSASTDSLSFSSFSGEAPNWA